MSGKDINELMRDGHLFMPDVERLFMDVLDRCVALRGRAHILEIGCASGLLAAAMASRFPQAEITANEELPELAAIARERLSGTGIELHAAPFAEWSRPVDVLISAGSHHHLPHDYLAHARRVLKPRGTYLMVDEFCPNYLVDDDIRRLSAAKQLHVCGGYLLSSEQELAEYQRSGAVPAYALEMEQRRKRALWRWYRAVVDHAVENGHIEVAVAELKSAHDDLITGSSDEHKLCPGIFERQLELAGFSIRARHCVGPADDPVLQSFFIYEAA